MPLERFSAFRLASHYPSRVAMQALAQRQWERVLFFYRPFRSELGGLNSGLLYSCPDPRCNKVVQRGGAHCDTDLDKLDASLVTTLLAHLDTGDCVPWWWQPPPEDDDNMQGVAQVADWAGVAVQGVAGGAGRDESEAAAQSLVRDNAGAELPPAKKQRQ